MIDKILIVVLCLVILNGIIKTIKFIKELIDINKEIKNNMFGKYKTYNTSEGFGSSEDWKKSFKQQTKFSKNSDNIIDLLNELNINLDKSKNGSTSSPRAKKEGLKYCTNSAELKLEYRRLMQKYHPDVAGDTKENTEMAKKINNEYSALSSKFKRLKK